MYSFNGTCPYGNRERCACPKMLNELLEGEIVSQSYFMEIYGLAKRKGKGKGKVDVPVNYDSAHRSAHRQIDRESSSP